MSTLDSLSKQQEDYLFDELQEKLSVNKNQEIEIWPDNFLKSNKIVQDLTEKELKVLNIDYASLIRKIALHNPELLFCWTIQDTRFDFDTKWPKQIRETLRMRRKKTWNPEEGQQRLLTIKKKNLSSSLKERPEFEVPIRQYEKFNEMFRYVWLLPLPIKEKVRQSYKIHSVTKNGEIFDVEDIILDLDAYYESIHIPPLLEIEWKDHETITKWIRILGLENNQTVNWSSRQMLRHYHQWPWEPYNPIKNELAATLLNGNWSGKKPIGAKAPVKPVNWKNNNGSKAWLKWAAWKVKVKK